MIVGINNLEELLFLYHRRGDAMYGYTDVEKKIKSNPRKYKIVNLGETELF